MGVSAIMVQITSENRPVCAKPNCNNLAICYLNKMWLCGGCVIVLQEKIDKLKQKLILEG